MLCSLASMFGKEQERDLLILIISVAKIKVTVTGMSNLKEEVLEFKELLTLRKFQGDRSDLNVELKRRLEYFSLT